MQEPSDALLIDHLALRGQLYKMDSTLAPGLLQHGHHLLFQHVEGSEGWRGDRRLKERSKVDSVSFLHCTPGQNQFYIGVTSLLLLPAASSRPARQRQLHYMCSMSIYEVSLPIKSVRSHNSVVSVLYFPSLLFPYSCGASPLKLGLLLE